MTWAVVETMDDQRHVMPVNDRRVHKANLKCWCEPRLDAKDTNIVVHNSVDRREFAEFAEVAG